MSWQSKINNIKRILAELQALTESDTELRDDGIIIYQVDDDIYRYSLCLTFLDYFALYYGYSYFIKMTLPPDYPCHAPDVEFVSYIFHPNVNPKTGRVCRDFSSPIYWSARNTIQSFVYALQCLVLNPITRDPENKAACDIYLRSIEQFKEQATNISNLNDNSAFLQHNFYLPEEQNLLYERSRYLQKAERGKQYVKLTIEQRHHARPTEWVGRQTPTVYYNVADSYCFLQSGVIDKEVSRLEQRPRFNHSMFAPKLLYNSCGRVLAREAVGRITKCEPLKQKVETYNDIEQMMRESIVSEGSIRSQTIDLYGKHDLQRRFTGSQALRRENLY